MKVNVRQLRQSIKQVLDTADTGETIEIVRGKSVYTLSLGSKSVYTHRGRPGNKERVKVAAVKPEPNPTPEVCEHGAEPEECRIYGCENAPSAG